LLVADQQVLVRWNGKNREWYETKGYRFTKNNDIFCVSPDDIPFGSHVKVQVECDYCKKKYPKSNQDYRNSKIINKNILDCCFDCIGNKSTGKNQHRKITIDIVEQEFLKRDMLLLPNQEYVNAKIYLDYLCIEHLDYGVQQITWDCLYIAGGGCRACGNEKLGNSKRKQISQNELIEVFQNKNFELLPNQAYQSVDHVLHYKCLYHPDLGVQKTTLTSIIKNRHVCDGCYSQWLRSDENPRWHGGSTSLFHYLRANINQWKLDSMRSSNYRCVLSGDKFDDIHHLKSFEMLVIETMNELELEVFNDTSQYTMEEISSIKAKCLEIHYRYQLGVCLRRDLHILFHSLYGRRNVTPSKFEQFKTRYMNGEFSDLMVS
jgi:hypothetical protein